MLIILFFPVVITSHPYFKNLSYLGPLQFVLALVLLPLKDFYYNLIAIRSGMAFGVKTVSQPIDKISKYWWKLVGWYFLSSRNAEGFLFSISRMLFWPSDLKLWHVFSNNKCFYFYKTTITNVLTELKIQEKRKTYGLLNPRHGDKAVTIRAIVPWKAEVFQFFAVALKSHMKPITPWSSIKAIKQHRNSLNLCLVLNALFVAFPFP